SGLEPFGAIARVVATIVAALFFAPIKDQFQVWLDKVFYRERYSIRQTLLEFGRTSGSEVHLDKMVNSIGERLRGALSVDQAGVFLESPSWPEHFVSVHAVGFALPPDADLSFLKTWTDRPHLFFDNDVCGLNHFIPCRVKDRAIAYIGLGRTKKGDYL